MVAPTLTSLSEQSLGNNAAIYTWAGLPSALAGAAVSGPGWTDRSIQFTGTFGGAAAVLEGSNDGTTYFTLHDPFNNALSFTSANFAEVTEIALFMRPRIANGDGTTAITAVLVCCNHQPA